jgi:uncharacterized protein
LTLQRTIDPQQKTFTAYGEGYVSVNGERFIKPIVLTPEQIFGDWNAPDFASLTAEHFDYFLSMKPEVLLFGTGEKHEFPHPQLYRNLINAGIAIEFMSTPAACRTYNILIAEDRKVVAAVLI